MAMPKLKLDPRNFCNSIKKLCFSSKFGRPICTKLENNNTLSTDATESVARFISIFTKQPFSPDNPELISLSRNLTNKVVESVLNNLRSWKVAHLFFIWASNQYGYKHNMYTYNAMASILSRARQNASLRILAQDVVNSRCFMSPGALGFFIRCLGSVELVEEANILFDKVKREGLCVPNSYSYNCLLEAVSKSSSADLVEMRLKEMFDKGWGYDKYTLTPVLQVYCNSGKSDKALRAFNEMLAHGWVDEHVFCILLVAFSKWGEVDKASELIERMEDFNVRLNEKTFCVLIHGFVKESRVDKALQLFSKMKKSGLASDASIYDVMIGGLCKNKQLETALQLYSEMKQSGIKPDVGVLSKLLTSCSDEGELTMLLNECLEDLDVNTRTLLCNSVMSILVRRGSIDKAYSLLQAMIRGEPITDFGIEMLRNFTGTASPDASSFGIVFDTLLIGGKLDLALNLLREMKRVGSVQKILLYNNLIDGLCNSNRLEDSYELLREMEESGFRPTHFTLNSIYHCLCRRQDVVGALNLMRKMRVLGHEPWVKHTTLLIKTLCKHGKAIEAFRFLTDMVQEGFLPNIVSFSAAMGGLIDNKRLDLALDLFRDLCSRGCCPDVVAYNIMINGLCKAQRFAEARDLFNEMIMKGLIPSVTTYNLLIDGWCKSGDIDQAMFSLSRMFEEERVPNVITYTTLIDGLCSTGRPDDAVMLWSEMEEKGCVPNRITFMALISGLSKCGRPETALVYFHMMKKRGMKPDMFVFISLISAFLSEQNLPSAFAILKEMVDEDIFPDPLDKAYVVVRDAILKLSEDNRTAAHIKSLIKEGSISTISLSDTGCGGTQPTVSTDE